MGNRIPDPKNSYIPTSYEDLYLYYIARGNSLCRMLVRSFIPYLEEDEREALVHDVFLRCFEKKALTFFDPDKSNFGGVIFFVTRSICVNFLSRRQRNPLTGLNAGSISRMDVQEDFEPGVYHLDAIFHQRSEDIERRLDNEALVEKIFTYARERFSQAGDKRDRSLLALLKLLREEVQPKDCAILLDVTPSTVYNWIFHLREVLKQLQAV